MRNKPSKWDLYYMRLAREASRMSKDPSSKIGAVLVKNRRVIATGYNGFPPGIADNSRLNDRSIKYELVVHAEMNTLLQAGRDANGATLYMYGFESPPCRNCTKHVIAAGVVRVVGCGKAIPARWQDDLGLAAATLQEAEIPLSLISMEDLDS